MSDEQQSTNNEQPRDLLGEHLANERRKREEAEALKNMPIPTTSLTKGIGQPRVYAGVAPTEQQSPDAFNRYAETYGNIIKELKRSGRAKVPADGSGVNAKTLSEHLRAIRRAIKLFHYTDPNIDPEFDMEAYTFAAIGDHVLVEPRTGKARTAVLSAAPAILPPLLVQTSEELKAVFTVFSLKDSNGRDFAIPMVAVYVTDSALQAELLSLFSAFRINAFLDTFEIVRATISS